MGVPRKRDFGALASVARYAAQLACAVLPQ